VQWLLDRAAVRDAIVRTTVEAELRADAPVRNFLGSRLVDVDGDEAVADSYALVTPFDADGDRARPSAVITPQRWSHRCTRIDGRWQVVGHVVDGPDLVTGLPAVPASDDPRVCALLDRAAVLDVVVHATRAADRRDGGARHWSFANNHLVDLAGDRATVRSYVFEIDQPAGAAEPTSWTDGARRYLDTLQRDADGSWRIVGHDVADNLMPDDKVIVRPAGEQSIEALTRRAQELARQSE
jgi:SnoaL-like domain